MARRLEASDQKAKELAKKLEARSFNGGEGEEYEASKFGGVGDYMRNKRIKLQNRDAYIRAEHAPSYPPLFRGLAIWINGETYPTPYELGQLIVKHSGVRFQYLEGKTQVTHIIASNLTLKKRVEFSRYKVVRPEWITESIKAGVLLPWNEFRLIDETPAQRKLSFSSPAISRRSSASGDGSPGNAAGVFLGIKKVVDRPIATPGSSFMKRVVERQISETGPSSRATNWPITTPENSRAKEATKIGQYVSQPIATPSSSIKKVVDQPRPGSSSLPRDIVIPPSDELDPDEYDEFPSYQLPTNNTSFTQDSDDQPRRQSNEQDKTQPPFPQIDSHLCPPKEEKQGIILEPSREEDEDEDIDPVNLVFMPPSSPILPKGAAQPNPATPKPNIFSSTHSSLSLNTFLPHLAQKAAEIQKIHAPLVSEQPSTSKKSRTRTSPKLGPLVSAPSSRPEAVTIIDGQEAYEVEAFIGENNYPKRKNRRAWTEYLVLWKGYPLEEASWEPERQLKQDLKDGEFDKLLKEWRRMQRRKSGTENEEENKKAKVSVEVPKKVLKSLDDKDSRAEDVVMEEPIVRSSSPASVIVVRQPPENKKTEERLIAKTNTEKTYGASQVNPSQRFKRTNLAVDTKVGLWSVNDDREIRDSLSPEDMMDEDKDFGWGAEEEQIMGSESGKLFTQMVGESIAKSPVAPAANNSSQPKSNQRDSPQIPNGSFESIYGTPVDFAGDFKEETLGEDLDIAQAPKPPTKDIVSPINLPDPMEDEGGEAEKHDSLENVNMVDDGDPFEMEFLTPVELLEEREALPITQHLPKVAEPLERPSRPPEESLVPPPEATLHSQMTAEQKMATYLSNPGIREQTCLNPGFLQKFHEESRLHQLSTWKAKLRAELQALAEAKSSTGQIKPNKSRPRRYILHVDFDCFFAAVSTRDRPDLAGKPVAITHGNAENSTSSDIASCNYVAREFGVKNGMWMEEARKLCPGIICLPYEFTKYEAASKAFYEEILSTGAERVQAVSVDEALVDISNLCCDMELEIEQEESMASVIATQIRNNCREKTGGLEVSVGIGGNVLLAKLAMKKAKPAGQYSIKSTAVLEFMNEVEVRELPGIGYNIAKKVEEKLGTNKVRDVRGISKERLKNLLGEKTGEKLWGYCRGLDDTVVGQMTVRKSVSVDVNWGIRFENQEQAEKFLLDIAEEIEKRMKQEGVKGKHLTLKVSKRAANAPFITPKHLGCGKCDTLNKSITLGVATSNKDIIGKEAVTMLRTCRISPGELRGLGLTIARLEGIQPGKSDSSQKRLDYFKKEPAKEPLKNTAGEGSNGKKPEVVIREENVPPERPPIKAYVKPKVATLLDSFSKIAAARKEKAQLMQVQQEPEQLPDIPMGTQIDISMGVDPEVLPYLPTQHRNYIMQKMKEKEEEEQRIVVEEFMQPQPSSQPPPGSQYDIEIWNQLGSEMRAEIIAEHEAENRRIAREQGIAPPNKGKPLPPSPRKNRPLPWANNASVTPPQSPKKIKPVPFRRSGVDSPPKKKRGRPPGTKAGPSVANVNHERILDMKGNDVSSWLFDEGEVDREWFEAVDEESRQHQIAQAVKTRELRLEAVRKQELKEAAERERLASAVRLPMPSKQYTLGSGRAVGTIEQIRDTLSDWYEQCAEFGPHEDDTEEFARFLKRLVLVEHNIPKADEVVRYFLTMVGHEEGEWKSVVEEFAKAVNGALLEMGLGPIDFETG